MRRKWVASGFSVTGRFAAGLPCVIVVVVGWSVVVLVVEVKWIRVIGCRNLPGNSLQMCLMISFVVKKKLANGKLPSEGPPVSKLGRNGRLAPGDPSS